jgi:hypothetical protein
MDDAEPWTLSAVCDGCLNQGRWALFTFIRRCPVPRGRGLDDVCPVKELLKIYVDGVLLAEKETLPFRVMSTAAMRWAANHVFEGGHNLNGWLDDVRFYDFALTDEGVTQLLNTTSSLDCFDVVPPLRGGWGTCSPDGVLRHGTSCFLTCALGYVTTGDHPYCSYGRLYNNSIACLPTVIGNNCTDPLAENYNSAVPPPSDDGSCNFTCPTIVSHYSLPAAGDVCIVYNPNNWFEWRGLLSVPAGQVAVLQGSSMMSQYSGRIELAAGSTLIMRSTVVQHQHSSFGGAVESVGATLLIEKCVFQYNVADNLYVLPGAGYGGAVYMHGGGKLVVSQTQFLHNAGQVGGSIALVGVDAEIHACAFSSNTAFRKGISNGGGAVWAQSASVTIHLQPLQCQLCWQCHLC